MSQFDQSGAESTAVVLYSAVHPEFKEEEESKEETKTQSESITKKSITYTGLCNQGKHLSFLIIKGATCYMNSLLQTLFMTEEFRRKLYKWKFDEQIHGQILYSIPYQLQKLFANLQLKHHCYVQTRALTKSKSPRGIMMK
jgi:ubiquitin C-terminal hydrolase